ncbi:MAG: hypothetical protein KJ955_04765 [Nanoarchaeota archaeon]|nr:hypothetical protein [Nanoarchaeota archaeon]
MNKTLAVIVAAAGMAGCAKSYHYQSEIVDLGIERHEVVKYVESTRDMLKLGYEKLPNLFHGRDEIEWKRLDVNDSCNLENVQREYHRYSFSLTDDGCNGTVDRAEVWCPQFGYRYVERNDLTEDNAFALDIIFAYERNVIDRDFDIDTQIEEWQARH